MGRFYRIPYTGTLANSTGDSDLVVIQPADDKPCKLVGWIFGQSTEVGDSAEENLRITVRHMTATVTVTGGTSVTAVPNRPGTDTASGATITCNNTTVTTTNGTSTIMEEFAWNIRQSPFERWIPEELRPRASQGEVLIVRMESTPADDITGEVCFFMEEE